jgi:hypothetical protein
VEASPLRSLHRRAARAHEHAARAHEAAAEFWAGRDPAKARFESALAEREHRSAGGQLQMWADACGTPGRDHRASMSELHLSNAAGGSRLRRLRSSD